MQQHHIVITETNHVIFAKELEEKLNDGYHIVRGTLKLGYAATERVGSHKLCFVVLCRMIGNANVAKEKAQPEQIPGVNAAL